MKKVLVLSDSHGNVNNMVKAVQTEQADLVIHLGDCQRDCDRLIEHCPDIKLEKVPGNCDMSFDFPVRILEYEGFRIMACHGHTFHVKSGYLNLDLGARERKAQIALFGHTHQVYYANNNGIVFLNPGSIGAPPIGIPASYGILLLDESMQTIKYDVKYIAD